MTARWQDQFTSFSSSVGATSQPAAQVLRKNAIERFMQLGFPTTKNEDWHFTSVAPIVEREFTFVPARTGDVGQSDLQQFGFGPEWHTAVFVNGRFASDLSDLRRLDSRVKVLSLSDAWSKAPELAAKVGTILTEPEKHAFTMLNTAFMPDGVVIHVPKDVELEAPIHVLFVSDAHAAKTVMHHSVAIYRKLGVAGRSAATAWAFQNGVMD